LILPVATATVERAFSAMKIIKTDLRNKMNDDWMNHSMLCYIERDIFTSIEDDKILDCFQSLRSREKQIPHAGTSSGKLLSYEIKFKHPMFIHPYYFLIYFVVFLGSGSSPMIDEEMVG
jgi:hypothetical protein